MEGGRNDTVNLLLHGCSLARNLESNLSVNAHPMILSHLCDEIIGVFSMVRDRLNSMHPTPPDNHHLPKGRGKGVAHGSGGGRGGRSASAPRPTNPRRSLSRDSKKEIRRWVRVAAPLVGNTEVPPEDGFTWRKYGQKEILNAHHPRSYYRCTHQKLYSCPAKKQVQRLDHDSSTFEILYRGDHTCHVSTTVPSAVDLPVFNWAPQDIPRLFLATSCDAPHHQGTDGGDFIHHTGLDFDLVDHAMDHDVQFE